MSLLFDEPLIAGLHCQEDLMSEAEEKGLLDRLVALELTPFRFHGWTGNRKTQSSFLERFTARNHERRIPWESVLRVDAQQIIVSSDPPPPIKKKANAVRSRQGTRRPSARPSRR